LKVLLAAVFAVLGLAGCASVPMGDSTQDTALKNFSVPSDRSAIYVYRNESMGASIKMDVLIDNAQVGQTAAKTFLYKEVTPGKHTVTSSSENTDTLDIETSPGKATYVWQEVKMGVLYARTKLHLVDAEEGKKGVLETKLAASTAADKPVAHAAPQSPTLLELDRQIVATGLSSKPSTAMHLDTAMVLNKTWIYPHPLDEANYGIVELTFNSAGLVAKSKRGSSNGSYEIRDDQLCIVLRSSGTTCYFLVEESGQTRLFFSKSRTYARDLSIR